MRKPKMFKKTISLILSISLILTQPVFAQGVAELNIGKYLSQMPALNTDSFRPPHLRYISYDIKSNDFKLLLDQGDAKLPNPQTPKLQESTQELFNYFLIGLSLPNDKFWVNLRPDAPEQIIDPLLEKTDIGKIMLEADLQLKKDTASLTSPQNPEGKAYWDKLYKKAGELFPAAGGSAFGGENITIPTITRPWIVPGEVIIRESEDSAYIYKANLKVMLEEDYLTGRGGSRTAPTFADPRMKELNKYSTELIKELILPRLTQEVNISKKYAQLRQVFFSLILSRWFKDKYKGKPGQYSSLIDSRNIDNLTSQDPWSKDYYFSEYKKSFLQGEYNLKEQVSTPTGQVIRSYVSGGINVTGEAASSLIEGAYKVIKNIFPVFLLTTAGLLSVSVEGNVGLAKTSLDIGDERAGLPAKYIRTGKYIMFLIIDKEIGRKIISTNQPYLSDFYRKKFETLEDIYNWAIEIRESNPGISKKIIDKIKEQRAEIRLILKPRLNEISDILKDFKYSLAGPGIGTKETDIGSLPEELIINFNKAVIDMEKKPDFLLYWIDDAVDRIAEDVHKEWSKRKSLKIKPSEKLETLFWDTELKLRKERVGILEDIYQSLGKGSSPVGKFKETVDKTFTLLEEIYQEERFEGARNGLADIKRSFDKNDLAGERIKILFDIIDVMHKAYLESWQEQEEQFVEKYQDVWNYLYHAAEHGKVRNARNSIAKIKQFIPEAINSIQGKPKALQEIKQYVGFRETKEGIIVDNIKSIGDALITLKAIFASTHDDKFLELDELLLEDVWFHAIMKDIDNVHRSPQVKEADKNKAYLDVLYKDRGNWLDLKPPMYGYTVTTLIALLDHSGSSPLVQDLSGEMINTAIENEVGGVDFRKIEYLAQPIGSFRGLDLCLPLLSKAELEGIDINRELEAIEQMVNAKIDVSTDRLKRLLAAMSQKDAFTAQRETQLLPLLLRLCWLKEEKGAETTRDFRAVLLIADTGLFVEQGNTRYSLN